MVGTEPRKAAEAQTVSGLRVRGQERTSAEGRRPACRAQGHCGARQPQQQQHGEAALTDGLAHGGDLGRNKALPAIAEPAAGSEGEARAQHGGRVDSNEPAPETQREASGDQPAGEEAGHGAHGAAQHEQR